VRASRFVFPGATRTADFSAPNSVIMPAATVNPAASKQVGLMKANAKEL
jgi:hypothetical protein